MTLAAYIAERNDRAGLHDGQFGGLAITRLKFRALSRCVKLAPAISLPCIDQRDIAGQGYFQQAIAAVITAGLAPVGQQGVGAGGV